MWACSLCIEGGQSEAAHGEGNEGHTCRRGDADRLHRSGDPLGEHEDGPLLRYGLSISLGGQYRHGTEGEDR